MIIEQMISAEGEEFIRYFESKVKQTIDENRLLSSEDNILVAVSGGKDSTAVLYLLKKFGYNAEAVTVDAHIGCYTQKNLENIRSVCNVLDVKLHEIPFRKVFGASLCYIRDSLKEKGLNLKSCTVCGVLRRYLLNKKARELKATKLVTGHNLDDEAQALMMNVLKNKLEMCARTGPLSGLIEGSFFVQRAKPLFFAKEKEVERYSKLMNFPVQYGKCPCSIEGFRNQIKDFLNIYEYRNPDIKVNIINYFLEIAPKIKERFKAEESPALCSNCGEPCKDTNCRTCQILSNLAAA